MKLEFLDKAITMSKKIPDLRPSIHDAATHLGHRGTEKKKKAPQVWLNRKASYPLGKGAAFFRALEARRWIDAKGLSNVKSEQYYEDPYTNHLRERREKMGADIERTLSTGRHPEYANLLEFEKYQYPNGGITWGWNYHDYVVGPIEKIKTKNATEKPYPSERWIQALEIQMAMIKTRLEGSTYKIDILENVNLLPKGKSGEGFAMNSRKKLTLHDLQEGLEFGPNYTIRYESERDIIKIRKALFNKGFTGAGLEKDPNDPLGYSNVDGLSLLEVILYEVGVVKNDPMYGLQEAFGVMIKIGNVLTPGTRIQKKFPERDLDWSTGSPKLRIFMISGIIVNILGIGIVHYIQDHLKQYEEGHAGQDKAVLAQTIAHQKKKLAQVAMMTDSPVAKKFKVKIKVLSIDYSAFDHTVSRVELYLIRYCYMSVVLGNAHDALTKDFITFFRDKMLYALANQSIIFPKETGGDTLDTSSEIIYLYNHLASGIYDTQLAGTIKSKVDVRDLMMSVKVDDKEGFSSNLSDDIFAIVTVNAYVALGGSYDRVNATISDVFAGNGNEVNPRKQPPSHDGGVFLQYYFSASSDVFDGGYSFMRTSNGYDVPEGGQKPKSQALLMKLERNVERVGIIATLSNLTRNKGSFEDHDSILKQLIRRFLEEDPHMRTVIQFNYSANEAYKGHRHGGLYSMMVESVYDITDIPQLLNEDVYRKTGIHEVVRALGSESDPFENRSSSSLPQGYVRLLDQMEVVAAEFPRGNLEKSAAILYAT